MRIAVLRRCHHAHGRHVHSSLVPGDSRDRRDEERYQHDPACSVRRCGLHHFRWSCPASRVLHTVHASGILPHSCWSRSAYDVENVNPQ